ncbi:MAG: hypothetical protein RBQ97_07280, partial [Acholeplasma sp.]|nr:hypothetical protein [Acholeplasma sp.]
MRVTRKIMFVIIVTMALIFLVGCDNKEKMTPNEDSLVPYIDDEWVAIWADEFNGDTLDLKKWTYEIDGNGGGNQELQYYTNKNAIVSNGT